MATLLFIYGTLKRGHCRAPMLAGQRFVRTARTEPRYRLLQCDTYPAMVDANAVGEFAGDGVAVEGELWEVDQECLARLDAEEGVDEQLYERADVAIEETPALMLSGRVQGYLYLRDTAPLPDCGTCWTRELERRLLGE